VNALFWLEIGQNYGNLGEKCPLVIFFKSSKFYNFIVAALAQSALDNSTDTSTLKDSYSYHTSTG